MDTAAPSSLGHPFCYYPDSQEFTKHLRNLWRCDKVSPSPKDLDALLTSRRVVTAFWRREALSHIRGDGYRSRRLIPHPQNLSAYIPPNTKEWSKPNRRVVRTLIASAMVFASGVDHSLWGAAVDKHRIVENGVASREYRLARANRCAIWEAPLLIFCGMRRSASVCRVELEESRGLIVRELSTVSFASSIPRPARVNLPRSIDREL